MTPDPIDNPETRKKVMDAIVPMFRKMKPAFVQQIERLLEQGITVPQVKNNLKIFVPEDDFPMVSFLIDQLDQERKEGDK